MLPEGRFQFYYRQLSLISMISIIERHAEMHISDYHFAQQIVIHKCHLFHALIDHNSYKEHYLTREKLSTYFF